MFEYVKYCINNATAQCTAITFAYHQFVARGICIKGSDGLFPPP